MVGWVEIELRRFPRLKRGSHRFDRVWIVRSPDPHPAQFLASRHVQANDTLVRQCSQTADRMNRSQDGSKWRTVKRPKLIR